MAEPLKSPAIALVPYYLKLRGPLADVALDDLEWPIGRPENLEGEFVRDLSENDHLFTYPRGWVWGRKVQGMSARLSLMIVEPRSFHWQHMLLARFFHHRFHRVLTCDEQLLKSIPNAVYFVFGSTWVPGWRKTDCTKTKDLSLIASNKKSLKGHKLRHKIVAALRAQNVVVDVMGGGYKPFEDKADGLAPYRYSIVIENTRQPGYFTEKLIDALLLKTVPIYWGAPDIGKFFDTKGMIICHSKAEILAAAKELSEQDYNKRLPILEANKRAAVKYSDILKSAAIVLRNSL